MTYGARPIRRTIQTKIEDGLADAFLDGEIHVGDAVEIGLVDMKVTFRVMA